MNGFKAGSEIDECTENENLGRSEKGRRDLNEDGGNIAMAADEMGKLSYEPMIKETDKGYRDYIGENKERDVQKFERLTLSRHFPEKLDLQMAKDQGTDVIGGGPKYQWLALPCMKTAIYKHIGFRERKADSASQRKAYFSNRVDQTPSGPLMASLDCSWGRACSRLICLHAPAAHAS